MQTIYIDKNHRIVKINNKFYPEYRPYLFRYKLTSHLFGGGWTNYYTNDNMKDKFGNEHKKEIKIEFKELSKATNWLKKNKV